MSLFFFFQAEDGIRDLTVTGVQTCALPISCGIATDRLKLAIYGSAGVFFGLCGVMQLSRLPQGDPTVAIRTELDVIAAVVIGGGRVMGAVGAGCGPVGGPLSLSFLCIPGRQ